MLNLRSLWLLLILDYVTTLFHFTMSQMYRLKINDHQLFFPQAYGTEVNHCPSLDLSADHLSDQGQDTFQEFGTKPIVLG